MTAISLKLNLSKCCLYICLPGSLLGLQQTLHVVRCLCPVCYASCLRHKRATVSSGISVSCLQNPIVKD